MWRREGDEVVWTGEGPFRLAVGSRAVYYWPGERLPASRATELGIPVDVPPPRRRAAAGTGKHELEETEEGTER